MRYLIYHRVSTEEQDIEKQNTNCLEFISKQPEQGAIVIFSDPDTSSGLPLKKRPGVCDMLEAVKKKDLVVVAKLDRFSRDTLEMIQICRAIRARGADFYSLAEGTVEDWMLGIWGALAQKERQNIRERTKSGLAALKNTGQRVGHIPYGYKLVEDIKRTKENRKEGVKIMITENPAEIAVLKEMERLRADDIPYRQCAQLLNDRGYRNRDGQPWTHNAVCRVYKGFNKRS